VKGHVDSLSPASGLEFALLPPDNATGNFTKIVQRVPVKIVFNGNTLMGRCDRHVSRADCQHKVCRDPRTSGDAQGPSNAFRRQRLIFILKYSETAMTMLQPALNAPSSVVLNGGRAGGSVRAHGVGKDLVGSDRRRARRLHGGAQYPDRQRVARRHPWARSAQASTTAAGSRPPI